MIANLRIFLTAATAYILAIILLIVTAMIMSFTACVVYSGGRYGVELAHKLLNLL